MAQPIAQDLPKDGVIRHGTKATSCIDADKENHARVNQRRRTS